MKKSCHNRKRVVRANTNATAYSSQPTAPTTDASSTASPGEVITFTHPDPVVSSSFKEEKEGVTLSQLLIMGAGARANDPLLPKLPPIVRTAVDQRLSLGAAVQLTSSSMVQDTIIVTLRDFMPTGECNVTAFARVGVGGKWVEMLRKPAQPDAE